MSSRWLVWASFALAACGAGEGGTRDGSGARDGGVRLDAGPARDAGPSRDAGPIRDGGPPPVDPACTENGCLREISFFASITREELLPLLMPGVSIDNGYAIYTVRFATDDDESLATVTIPHSTPPAEGFAIVGNNHGTSGVDDPCRLSDSAYGAGLAGLFGARGMIGVAVDYPGLGTPGLHPYLVRASEGAASLDGLRAARHLAERLGAPTSGRYAVVGLSQGGHATIAAAMRHSTYAPELDIRAFSATAPASVWDSQWSMSARLVGSHHVFFVMAFAAWADHYAWPASPFLAAARPSIDDALARWCVSNDAGGPTLFTTIAYDPTQLYEPAFLDAFAARDWSSFPYIGDNFEANAVRAYDQTAPLRIYQGTADAIVPEAFTAEVVTELRAGGVDVDYVVVPGGTHTDVAWGFLANQELRTDESIAWIRARLAE